MQAPLQPIPTIGIGWTLSLGRLRSGTRHERTFQAARVLNVLNVLIDSAKEPILR